MADPYLKNGRWYIRFKDGKGDWRDRATDARTKAEARRLSSDLERRCERQRLGLEPLPSDEPELTFGAAMDLWQRDVGQHLRSQTIRGFMEKHLRPELGELPLSDAADALGRVIRSKKGKLAPETMNRAASPSSSCRRSSGTPTRSSRSSGTATSTWATSVPASSG